MGETRGIWSFILLNRCIKNNRIVLTGIFFGLLVWPVDAFIDSSLIYNDDFVDEMFYPSTVEVYIRLSALFLFIVFSLIAQAITKNIMTVSEISKAQESKQIETEKKLNETLDKLASYKNIAVQQELRMGEMKQVVHQLLKEPESKKK